MATTEPRRPVAGVLLTGGSARRLGGSVDKARLVLEGATLAERGAQRLTAVCDRAVEVGPGYTQLPTVREPKPEGPLSALVLGADAVGAMPVLLLGVDLVNVSVQLLDLVGQFDDHRSVVPRVHGRSQLVCSRWSVDALEIARRLLADGERALRALERSAAVVHLDHEWSAVASAESFADVDTPADAARLGLEGWK